MMRKKLCLLLALIALSTCLCKTTLANAAQDVAFPKVDQGNSDSEYPAYDIHYFPFVYRDDSGFSWFQENIIKSSDFEIGYLYVKDLMTGDIRKLLDFKVDFIRENKDSIYCVVNGTELGVTDYIGSTYTVVYRSEGPIKFVELFNEIVYVVTESKVTRIDTDIEKVDTLLTDESINFFVPVDGNSFLWSNNEETTYLVEDFNVSLQRTVDEDEIKTQFLATEVSTAEYADSISPFAAAVNQPSLPLNSYPSGSYFTYDGGACGHHGTGTCSYYGGCNCRSYSSSIQCMGFAKYASDQYAHRSSWSEPSNDTSTKWVSFSTDAEVYAYFSSLPKGSYLRLANSSGNEIHSIVTLSATSSTITTYECNYSGPCMVSVESRSCSAFRSSYRYVVKSVAHHFTDCTYINSTYHKAACSSSGCTGYIYEHHYAGSNGACGGCGASGNIAIPSQSNNAEE